jgi:site-specific recombinase XerD
MEKVKISFLVKTTKEKENGTCPLYCRIIVGTETKELFLKSHLSKDDWDRTKQRVKPKNPEATLINAILDKTRSDANAIAANLRLTDKLVTARLIKDKLAGNSNPTSLLELFTKHNNDIRSRIGNDYSQVTLMKYELTLRKVSAFLKLKQQRNDIQLQELKYAFIYDFHNFLKAEQKMGHNSAMKHIKNLKKVVRLAMQLDIITKNPFDSFKCTVKEVNRNCLTQQDLDKLISKTGLNQRLEIVKDVFIFCTYTGLSYADVAKLNKSHLQNGSKSILVARTKTGVPCDIPLLDRALDILERYQSFANADKKGRLLPVNSNQKINEYLKEIAVLCDISKTLTFHLARHTFATTVAIANGVTLEVVQSILGHRNIRTTQIYAKMTDKRKSTEMEILNKTLIINPKNQSQWN